MRHKVKKVQLGSSKGHRTSIMRNLSMAVIIHEKIKTTKAKAKAIQPYVEKLITIAKKKNTREAIREIDSLIQHENSSKKLLEVLKDRYKDRNSGYTRITKLGFRAGDNAPLVQLELVK